MDGGSVNKVIKPMILIVVGLILTPIVATQASTAKTGLSSFSGAASLMDIVPLLWVAGLLAIAGLVGYGFYRSNMR